MSALVWFAVFGAGCGALGYVVGRGTLDDHDHGWLPPERRRWRP